MAPEVIELKGASTSADIWSLGCTIIELLTGKPPYGDMLAMSAMWRIVEDDCPPLPEKISPLLRDFLLLCFNKDPTMRPSAELLFEHQWLRQTWSGAKELRPQDSVPFLRRISADFRKVDLKSLHAAISAVAETNEVVAAAVSPLRPSELARSASSPPRHDARPELTSLRAASDPHGWVREDDPNAAAKPRQPSGLAEFPVVAMLEDAVRRGSEGSVDVLRSPSVAASNSAERGLHGGFDPSLLDLNAVVDGPEEPKAHAFVKSTFSKAVQCKICREPVKKHAVLCEECGLICHASCARRAHAPCNLRAQLLMFASQRSSVDLTRGASSQGFSAALGASSPAPSPSPGPNTQSPALGPTFRIPSFNKWKRGSKGSIGEMATPISPTTTETPVSPTGGEHRRRRISLLPGMGLGRARSPSPAVDMDTPAGNGSIARSFSSSQGGSQRHERAGSVSFGSVSGSSSVSSASHAMAHTNSTASKSASMLNNSKQDIARPAAHRHTSSQSTRPAAPLRFPSRGHRATHSAAISTPHLNRLASHEGGRENERSFRQRLTSFHSDARLASLGSKNKTDGAITPTTATVDKSASAAERRRARRASSKQDCSIM